MVRAGYPGKSEAAYRAAGIDLFIYLGSNIIETLCSLLHAEEAQP